ncbi:hypothetical protein T492DRAFT_906838, partial [Pavlovales sp. CCMP2436]
MCPLTEEMKEWASQHVEPLFELQAAQLRAAAAKPLQAARCFRESLNNLWRFRSGFADTVEIHPSQVGPLIGHGGSHIRFFESKTGAYLAPRNGPPATVTVHAPTGKSLEAAVAALKEYAQPARYTYIS